MDSSVTLSNPQDSTWKMCFFVFGQTVREERWGGVEGVGRSGEGVGMETLGVGGGGGNGNVGCRGMGSGHEKWEWEVGMEMGREG